MPDASSSTPQPGTIAESAADAWPSVSVVVPTRDRPELLACAVQRIVEQDYPGHIECIVVFDQCEPHAMSLDIPPQHARHVITLRNTRTPGLAGARNTGILAAGGEVIAHCDDDDEWLPAKLTRQIKHWRDEPDAIVISSGVTIVQDAGDHHRHPPARTTFDDLLTSRVATIHSSNILVKRADLVGRIGLIDEQLPSSFGEDYEWLLRAGRHGDIASVAAPLVRVNWSRPSFYVSKWQAMVDGLTYILRKNPEFARHPRGLARIQGQIAFAYAAMGERRLAMRWAMKTLRNNVGQPRALAAVLVAAQPGAAERVVRLVQATGRGL